MRNYLWTYLKAFNLSDWAWLLIWLLFPLGIKWGSLAIMLGGVLHVVAYFKIPDPPHKGRMLHLALPMALFIIFALNLGGNNYGGSYLKEMEQMLPLVAIPVFFLFQKSTKESYIQASVSGLFLSVLISGSTMLIQSLLLFLESNNADVFIYHQLTQPFGTGAIYYSHLFLILLLLLDKWEIAIKYKHFGIGFSLFVIVFLFLFASKTIIATGFLIMLFKYASDILGFVKKRLGLSVIVFLGVILLSIPVLNRYKPILQSNFDSVHQKSYQYDSSFNGLTLRLVQWRFATEILKEEGFLLGAGVNQSQELLNRKYIQYGLYTGDEARGDTGYLNYNCHNQFVETGLRVGVVGLTLLLLIMLRYIILFRSHTTGFQWVFFLYFMFFMTESVLERQFGIVCFSLIYSSAYLFNTRNVR